MPRLADAPHVKKIQTRRQANVLYASSSDQLFRIAAQHSPVPGGGRCARCGFVYTDELIDCPTLRCVRKEFNRRGEFSITPHPRPLSTAADSRSEARNQRPCQANPALWDMDQTTHRGALAAVGTCNACPLLTMCQIAAAHEVATGRPPSSMIWAAIPYDEFGTEIRLDFLKEFIARRDGRSSSAKRTSSQQSGTAA